MTGLLLKACMHASQGYILPGGNVLWLASAAAMYTMALYTAMTTEDGDLRIKIDFMLFPGAMVLITIFLMQLAERL